MRMDVTDIIKLQLSGSICNEGFIVKRSGSIGNTSSSLDEGSRKTWTFCILFTRYTYNLSTKVRSRI